MLIPPCRPGVRGVASSLSDYRASTNGAWRNASGARRNARHPGVSLNGPAAGTRIAKHAASLGSHGTRCRGSRYGLPSPRPLLQALGGASHDCRHSSNCRASDAASSQDPSQNRSAAHDVWQHAPECGAISSREHCRGGSADHRFCFGLGLSASGDRSHEFTQRFLLSHWAFSFGFEFAFHLTFEFALEFAFHLELIFSLAECRRCRTAEHPTEWAANGGPYQRRGDASNVSKDRRGSSNESADAASEPAKEFFALELALPFELEFGFELRLELALQFTLA